MFVKPNEEVTETLARQIKEKRSQEGTSCLDQPAIKAQHLRTQEELSMFYGQEHNAEVFGIVTIVAKAAAIALTLTAGILAVNGPSGHSSNELEHLAVEDLENLSVEDLLDKRRKQLA